MAFSKTATLILVLHTLTTLLASVLIQNFENNTTTPYPPNILRFFLFSVHVAFTFATFIFTSILNCCCIPRRSRVTFTRHVLTAILFAPLLAQITGRGLGWIISPENDKAPFAAACYDQLSLENENVLMAGAWCEYKTGLTRGQTEAQIGGRRKKLMYVAELGRTCAEGLRDIEHFVGLDGGICWMGERTGSELGLRKGEVRNGEKEHLRRAMEECHRRFGYEMEITEWRDDGTPVVRVKMPEIAGTQFNGDFLDVNNTPPDFNI
ncbi:hypothetical protein G7Y89_g4852 [Cudoniella acicularis]|uniref:Uncharacterized protein n=1 Tax=Cudoniella acicularis TaxID=354080 RepID=A0A8H4RRQ5_9HELO|nr:hypothetical protein G7Y89_g4852 [Cudoniella acicularis]